MFYSILFVFILQFSGIQNKENECGCKTDRTKPTFIPKDFFNIMKAPSAPSDQCLLGSKKNKLCDDNKLCNFENRMVLIPANKYQLGTDEIMIENDKEGPRKVVKLKSFYIDKYEVSNRDFQVFIQDNNYKTEAEVFGDSFVFTLFLNTTFKEQLNDFRVVQAPWWYKVYGSNWKHPHGPDSDLSEYLDHPVAHVSWNDAQAYCAWRNARLPTEAEWEAACRGGHNNTKYPWGDKLYPNKEHMANIWQGTFPTFNSGKDGFIGTNPVHTFSPNGFGLYNMAGNVWEWTEDAWSKNNQKEKVKKGGSYLCHRSYCYRYRCSARSHNTDDSSAGNLGFRCAKSV